MFTVLQIEREMQMVVVVSYHQGSERQVLISLLIY